MGPTRNKKTYSKTVATVPKTAEERRKRYKTRKVVPAFDQLFIKDDENKPKTPCYTKRGKGAKSDLLFEDSMADFQLPPPSTRKPLALKNGDNSSCGTSSHSSCSSLNENNDTFDKLFGNAGKVPVKPAIKTRTSQARARETKANNSKSTSNSSSSYCNSSDLNALLYASLLPQGASATNEISIQNFSQLLQINRKTVKEQKQAITNPKAKGNISPTQLFDTLKISEESTDISSPCSSSVPASPVPQRRTTRTTQSNRCREYPEKRRTRTTANIRKTATRNTFQETDLKNLVDTSLQPRQENKTTAAVVKNIEAEWSDESDGVTAQTRIEPKKRLSKRRSLKGKVSVKNAESVNFNKVKFVEKSLSHHESNHILQSKSPALHSSCKGLTVATPEDCDRLSVHNSRASHNSLSDVVTSTPANQNAQRRIPSNGTPWGVQLGPMLEDETLSPVQRDSCIQAPFERSSVFESPMTFRSKCRGSAASEGGTSPTYTTANEDLGIKTRTMDEIVQRLSLGTETQDEKIPVFDPENRVSHQFISCQTSVESKKQLIRKARNSKVSEMESCNSKSKRVSIKDNCIMDASGDGDVKSLTKNNLSNSIQTKNINDPNEGDFSLMQVSLSDIIQNYKKKRRRCTIPKKITDHETTNELIKIGVLGTRTSLRLESKIARQSTSNSPFIVPSSTMKSRRSRKVQEAEKLLESLSLSKTEGSFISRLDDKFKKPPAQVNGNSSIASSVTDNSPVIPKTNLRRSRRVSGDKRKSKRVSENKKQINVSTDQDLSQTITRPTRKRSSRIKSNISTDREQSYSLNVNSIISHASKTELSSKLPVRKSLRRKTSSIKDRPSTIHSNKSNKSITNEEIYNVSSYSTRSKTNDSLNNLQSTLDASSVLSTFTRQRSKRTDKVVFTKPDTSVSDYSVMSIGDSVVSIQSVNELPVIKENSDHLDNSSELNSSNEFSNKNLCSEESEYENVSSEDTEDENNEDGKTSDKDIDDEINEDEEISNKDIEDENSEDEDNDAILSYYEEGDEMSVKEISGHDESSEGSVNPEQEGNDLTENMLKENDIIIVDESFVSIEEDVSTYSRDESSLNMSIKDSELSEHVINNSKACQNSSVIQISNTLHQSKAEMSIGEPTDVIEKFDDLSLDKKDASMLAVYNSCNENSLSTSKLKQKPELDPNVTPKELNQSINEVNKTSNKVNLTSNKQSLSLLELEDACESLPLLIPGAKIPAKPGKGWRRSLTTNLLASFNESMGLEKEVLNDTRRQTVHRISDSMVKQPVVKISRLPVTFENKFHRRSSMVPINNISRLSQRKSSYCCVRKSSIGVPSDPRDHVLQLCGQKEPLPLSDCFTQSRLSCCKKIGEGVYGEVFMSRPNPTNMDGATVLKIMPIEGDFEINGERQKKFHEILSEIVISVELSNLRLPNKTLNQCETYVNVLKCWCLKGQYLPELLTFWDNFDADKGSENDRPDMFPMNQLYIVLEFGHGGTDLEGYVFNNAAQSLAVFRQIVMSLAVAEQELEFEHRDLHWGNVLVATTKETSIKFKIAGKDYTVNTQGVCSTIIDFTLSRLNAPHCVVYNNLGEDPDLFVAEGDYQFEIYRQMKITNNNNWESFNPYTNVLWLHYILDKMINECYYKKTTTKVHKTNLATLKQIKETLLEYKSATDYVLNE